MNQPLRPTAIIARELADAQRVAEATAGADRSDRLVRVMLESNDAELERLQRELDEAQASDLELRIEGRPVAEHRVAVPYLLRIVAAVQSSYRALAEMAEVDAGRQKPSRRETTLSLAGTAAGSFRVLLRTAPEALSLLDTPLSQRAMSSLLRLINDGRAGAHAWAAGATDEAVRAVIRLASTLASSHGTVEFRWTAHDGTDTLVTVHASEARALAAELAGASGREIIEIDGHLRMAQDDPPRVRITTATDEHLAAVRDDDLLDEVRELLFQEVTAEIVIDMSTSPTTGAPTTRSELLSLRPSAAPTTDS